MKTRQLLLFVVAMLLAASVSLANPFVRSHPGPNQTPVAVQGRPIVPPTVPPQLNRLQAQKIGTPPGS